MARQTRTAIARLMDIHWESHLVQIVDIIDDPTMGCQVGRFLENLRYIPW